MPGLDRYQRPEVYEALAAEYVLGTLNGRARQRFERLMDARGDLQAAVQSWQARLDPLGERPPEVLPPGRVWRRIERELRGRRRSSPAPRPGWWNNSALWRLTTAVAVLLLAVSLVFPGHAPREMPMPNYVAVLEAPGKGPMMVATGMGKPWTLTVAMMVDMDMPKTEQMRLWCIPKGGGKPIPMGRVGTDKYTVFQLSQREWERLPEMDALAVSVEPMGADAPEPMGPLKYKGRINVLTRT